MSYPKLYIGPMSKNIVDAAISSELDLGLIPSRRQIDYNGGYVNSWNTNSFASYVRTKTSKIIIQRDHGGPKQGATDDDGFVSVIKDCDNKLELIHIDPWKEFKDINSAAHASHCLITTALEVNESCLFEVGTEQSIRGYSPFELEDFLNKLKKDLGERFNRIKFAVIQSGVGLLGVTNTGTFNEQKCKDMISVCKDFGLLSKEHNGDYLEPDIIKRRFELGLDGINIAPELGVEETRFVLKEIEEQERDDLFDILFYACFKSKFWVKWLPEGFSAEDFYDQRLLVEVCCHYIFNSPTFKDVLTELNIEQVILKSHIESKIEKLHDSCK